MEPLEYPDRIETLAVPLYMSRDLNESVFDRTTFEVLNPWRGSRLAYDALITNNAGKGFAFAEMMGFVKGEHPPVVIWDFSTPFLGDCELAADNVPQLMRELTGYASGPGARAPRGR